MDYGLRKRGQASLEMTMAILGLLLLVLASVKVFWWLSVRLISRQKYYECTRGLAGRVNMEQLKADFEDSSNPNTFQKVPALKDTVSWDNDVTHAIDGLKLRIFGGEVGVPPLPADCQWR